MFEVGSRSPVVTWDALSQALGQGQALVEGFIALACVALGWGMVRAVAQTWGSRDDASILWGRHLVDGVMFPALLLGLTFLAQRLSAHFFAPVLLRLAVPVVLALLVIRLGVKVLQAAFVETPLVRLLERTISWVAWLALVMWMTGVLPALMAELDEVGWQVGGSTLTVRKMIEGALTAGLVLIVSLWISAALERRLLRAATGAELSLRMAVSNALRALMMFVGLLLALSAVGIDLTALSVLGGAVGVGIGFGLQKLAANYVSGFVILAERSMRIGDQVMVDGFTGIVTQINARYTVIRSLAGMESIVPNELLITSRVENQTLADKKVWQSTMVSVSYDADPDEVMRLLRQAALSAQGVMGDPAPAVQLMAFGADGLEFLVGYWIDDPTSGVNGVKSAVNLAILRALRQANIDIPYPQRVLHHRGLSTPTPKPQALEPD